MMAIVNPAGPSDSTIPLAELTLAAARAEGDPSRVATALADLGLARLKACDVERARKILEESLERARQVGNRSLETDILCGLGKAHLILGQPERAKELLDLALAQTRASGHRHAEKAVLDQLGQVQAALGEQASALLSFTEALSIAEDVGDQQHKADLQWRVAVQNAELGHRDQAISHARQSIDLLVSRSDPRAGWFRQHLVAFEGAVARSSLTTPPASPTRLPVNPSIQGIAQQQRIGPRPPPPGLLRMALDATEAMIRFVGSGFKTAPEVTYNERLRVCSACEHHTGLRCRICGCFTCIKANLQHETCPVHRWTA